MTDIRSHAFSIILAAAIFAVIGFYMISWAHQMTSGPNPRLLPMVVLLKWTLRAGSIVFAAAGVLVLMRLSVGLMLYGASALLACTAFIAVTIWEVTTPYYSGPTPLVLIVLAAWTGYTGVAAIRDFLAIARAPSPAAE